MLPDAFRRAGRPAVLGHRGSPRLRPENTIESFEAAMAAGADGVELDVMRCGSGELVVVHDPELRRLAGRRLRVREASWSELHELDVGSHLDPRFSKVRLCLLPEVLRTLSSSALVNVELKGQDEWWALDLGLGPAVAEALRASPPKDRFVVSSFNPFLLWSFRRAAPDIAAGFLFGDDHSGWRRPWIGKALGAQSLHPSIRRCPPGALAGWKNAGYGTAVWTVDDPSVARALHEEGADCIISNVPEQILAAFS